MRAIASVEELRGGLAGLPGRTLAVALAAAEPDTGADREAARAAFGLEQVEPDKPGAVVGTTACSWCGRHDPGRGLTQDYPRPAPPPPAVDIDTGKPLPVAAPEPAQVDNSTDMHCAAEADCQTAKAQAEPLWFDNQHRGWKVDWAKYREALAAQAAARQYESYRGGIYAPGFRPYYALTAQDEDELSALDYAALAEVRLAVEHCMAGHAATGELELTAPPGMTDPAAPQALPELVKFDPWQHTMRNPAHRAHTLGYHRQHPRVHDAASALARQAVRSG